MMEERIILELTPREAAAIYEMANMYSWYQGEFGPEVQAIYEALDDVLSAHIQHNPVSVTQFGPIAGAVMWMRDSDIL